MGCEEETPRLEATIYPTPLTTLIALGNATNSAEVSNEKETINT